MLISSDNNVASPVNTTEETQVKPLVFLPGNGIKITDTAKQIASIYRQEADIHKKLFLRGGGICCVSKDRFDSSMFLEGVTPPSACSEFEQVGNLVKIKKGSSPSEEPDYEPAVCTSSHAKQIFASRQFQNSLPEIKVVTSAPVIVEKNKKFEIINRYDEDTGILATGTPVNPVTLDNAKKLLHGMLNDYDFVSESDKSRALAALITPALVFGGVLNGRSPVSMLEADKSQSGKGFFNKLLCSIYSEEAVTVTQRGRGVGGTDESFDSALSKGKPFISLDNFRGKMDSPQIESFLTESRYLARIPYSGAIDIDPARYFVSATSNNLEMTRDLANRASIIRIRKRGDSYQYAEYLEGNILDHVKANQPQFLGAVFAIIKEWGKQGKPRTNDTRHDFRPWCRTLDWIVQNLLDCAPLLDGHREAQITTTHPEAGWLKNIYGVVKELGEEQKPLTALEIVERCELGGVELPGTNGIPFEALDDKGIKQACSQVGRKLSGLFKKLGSDDNISVGGFSIGFGKQKMVYASGKSEYANVYTFESIA